MPTESEEVAEDYRQALEDLSSNARFEISNLTVIARENTSYALSIAEVLEKHILKTAPSKKLPALYVLDSIVKNVGTPYTLYLGRNLFKTFMEAYTVVDNPTRKRMEEMLKTWKQPVAGAMDTRPVFSPELVRPIENALMKAKAAMMPQAQLPGRPRSALAPHRNTPTPPGTLRAAGGTPGMAGQGYHPYGPPPAEATHGQMAYPGQLQPNLHQGTPQLAEPAPFQPPVASGYGPLGAQAPGPVDVETLNSDIQNLIVAMRAEATHNPQDGGVQTRLRALLDLQRIVQMTSLPQDQLELIKKQVTELAAVTLRASAQNSSPNGATNAPPQPQPPVYLPPQQPPATGSVAHAQAPAGQGAVTLDSLLGPGALAAIMGRQPSSQGSTPNPAAAAVRSPQPAHAGPYTAPPAPPAQASGASSLLDQLRQAGLIPSTPTPTSAGAVAPPPPTIPPNIASILSAQKALSGSLAAPARGGLDVASLKRPARPETIASLYEQLGPPCTQCGRRFRTDDEGKRKKMAHMDWHFRVHQRGTEADKRGAHRSWYVDTKDWLKSREVVDSDHTAAEEDKAARASRAAAEAAKPKYIAVPDPSRGINNVCPICQDKFENKWLDTAQEWVWLDAVLVGGRAYHASCHDEATRDRESTPRRTPEPVLGKRKAESSGIDSPKARSLRSFG